MKKWLYFLLDDQGRSYRIDNNGVVSKTGQPSPLPNSPDGWQDISLGWERNMNRFGIVRSFSLPLGFVGKSNAILRNICLTGTVETKVYLLIKKLSIEIQGGQYRFIYRYFYKGELDLSTVELGDEKSTVQIMEGGLSKLLAANEGNTYELDLANDPEAIDIVTDGYIMPVTANYAVIEQDIEANNDYFLPVAYLNSDFVQVPTLQHQTCYYEQITDPAQLTVGTNFFFRVNPLEVGSFRIFGELKINNTDVISKNFGFQIRSEFTVFFSSGTASYAPGQHTITFDETITLPLLIPSPHGIFIQVIPGQAAIDLERSEFKIKYNYRFKTTITKGLKPSTLFKRICGKVIESESLCASDLLALNDNLVITSGDALRGIAGAKIKTSLKDFFQSFNCWLNAGMGIENGKLRIESKERYFPSSGPVFHLGKAKNLKVSFSSDLYCNLIKAGYQEQKYDENFGRYEFNNTFQFSTPITKIVKELNLIAPYRADPTGIEVTRINYDGKETTDGKGDNDVFVLNVDLGNSNEDGSYNLKRIAYDTLEGIPDESKSTIFNIEQLTPKRIVKKHGSWIRPLLKGMEDKYLVFQTTEKNRDLRTIKGSEVIDEDLNELIGNLNLPLFIDRYFEFDCQSPAGIVDALETNPNQLFLFEWDGQIFYGFLIKAGIAPDSNKEQTFKLLSTTQNDISKLI